MTPKEREAMNALADQMELSFESGVDVDPVVRMVTQTGFRLGWKIALKHSPAVLALVEALKTLHKSVEIYAENGLIENYCSDRSNCLSDEMDDAREALDAWEKETE